VTTWSRGEASFTHRLSSAAPPPAFFATSPAATITYGLLVLVQLVMAAITTLPSVRVPSVVGSGPLAASASGSPFAFASPPSSFLQLRQGGGERRSMSVSGTRSWRALGPGRLGTTWARSSSRVSE